MGFFSNQLSNVVEWEQFRDDMIFWKWDNKEIKKGKTYYFKMRVYYILNTLFGYSPDITPD